MNKLFFLKKAFHYIKKAWSLLEPISEETKENRFYFMIDLFYCYLRYGVLLRQYIKGKFYLRKNFERKTW